MEKKNKRLLILFLAVLLINLALFFIPKKGSSVNFDEDLFVLADASSIDQITFSGEQDYLLQQTADGWLINHKDPVDQGLIQLLMSIMQRVQVKRPAAMENPSEGVSVSFGGALSFMVSGNATRTKTYFTTDGKSYEVEIPGYRDYLAGIFELHPDQWKDRLVMDESWRTIQKLTLDYTESETNDFEIQFENEFFRVKGITPVDSSGVVEYLNQFQYWQANEKVSSGRFPKYDTLAQTDPLATLSIESINQRDASTYKIFRKLPGETFHLVVGPEVEMLIFDQRRVTQILRKQDDFKLTE